MPPRAVAFLFGENVSSVRLSDVGGNENPDKFGSRRVEVSLDVQTYGG